MSQVGGSMARGAAWMVLFKFGDRGLGLISTIVLARLLVPKDFGIVAMAMTIVGVLELLGTFSFDMALIQNPDPQRRHYDTAWTFNVLFGLTCFTTLMVVARPAAGFYEEPRLAMVIALLGLGSLAEGFQNVGVVAFRKEMQFNKEFAYLFGRRSIGFAVTLSLALIYRNYWALVAGMLTVRFAGLLLSYLMHPYRPWFSFAGRRDLFHFSKWLLINNVLLFLKNRFADFAIGKLAGPRALGLYNVGYQISSLPTTELVWPINRALFPGYAKMALEPAELRRGFVQVSSLIALFALPIGAGLAVTADPLVRLVLGPNWTDAIPLIQLLAFLGSINAILSNNSSVYLAMGKPRIPTMLMSLSLVITIPALIWLTAREGILGAAYTYLGSALLFTPIEYAILLKLLDLRLSRFLSVLWRPLLATGAMAMAAGTFVGRVAFASDNFGLALRLSGGVATGVVTYVAVSVGLWILAGRPDGAERIVLDALKRKLPFL